jgi:hypothetical protein
MPSLSVPHLLQQDDGYCLPACVEMVLTYYGLPRSQSDIAATLGIDGFEGAGVPASRATVLSSRSLAVTYQSGERDDLLQALADGIPPIVEVATEQLAYWQGEVSQHVVLLAAVQDDDGIEWATINDPAFDAPLTVRMDELLAAWQERDNCFIAIRRK